jgi:hypothetical protein
MRDSPTAASSLASQNAALPVKGPGGNPQRKRYKLGIHVRLWIAPLALNCQVSGSEAGR